MTSFITASVVKQDVNSIASLELPWNKLFGETILVTGATGMIPSYVVLTLLEANRIHNLDLTVVGLARSRKKFEKVFGETSNFDSFVPLFQDVTSPLPEELNVDRIIHGASAARPALHAKDPAGTITANILGTHHLLEYSRKHGVKSIALMSSAEVYGDVNDETSLISESQYGGIDILNPRACYSEGKRAAETLCAVYHHQYSLHFTAARFGHIYGPGLDLNDGRVQADFARDVLHGNNITLKSAGDAVRTYTYVSDAVSGLLTGMLRGESGAYNVSDISGAISIRGLAERFILSRPEKDLKLTFSEEVDLHATNKTRFQALDSNKLMELGWRPVIDLDEGISRTLSYYEETEMC